MVRWPSVIAGLMLLAACGGSSVPGRDYPRHQVAVGRLPNGQGFGIWVQRSGQQHVRLIAAIVPSATSMAAIRKELDSGRYGDASIELDQLKPPDDLVGLVGCSAHPAVLLYGLSFGWAGVPYPIHRPGITLSFAALPTDLNSGMKGAGVAWGSLTRRATLQLKENTGQVFYSHTYSAPPPYRDCKRGTESISYLPNR